MIILKPEQWQNVIKPRLVQDHGAKILISYVCQRELGFTVRQHEEWIRFVPPESGKLPRNRCIKQVHLDFFNEAALTWFQLKYL